MDAQIHPAAADLLRGPVESPQERLRLATGISTLNRRVDCSLLPPVDGQASLLAVREGILSASVAIVLQDIRIEPGRNLSRRPRQVRVIVVLDPALWCVTPRLVVRFASDSGLVHLGVKSLPRVPVCGRLRLLVPCSRFVSQAVEDLGKIARVFPIFDDSRPEVRQAILVVSGLRLRKVAEPPRRLWTPTTSGRVATCSQLALEPDQLQVIGAPGGAWCLRADAQCLCSGVRCLRLLTIAMWLFHCLCFELQQNQSRVAGRIPRPSVRRPRRRGRSGAGGRRERKQC
mmetsp:Transcript_78683/g.218523  ORF Transcript_78683/g.218523 Transcript_78683/m.218523 type:complete len:287 (-) Transcript_78683:198-1058(-)